MEEAVQTTELILVSQMLACLIRFDCSQNDKVKLKRVESGLSSCVLFCKHTLEKLTKLQTLFDSNQNMSKVQLSKVLSFNVGKIKNKKSAQKI